MQNKRNAFIKTFALCALAGSVFLSSAQAQRVKMPEAVRGGAVEVMADIVPMQEVELSDKLRLERLLKPDSAAAYEQVGEMVTGELEEMGRRLVKLEVPAGASGEMVLMATCGTTCDDLDLIVYNSAGDLLGYDDYTDTLPALSMRGLSAGDTLTAEVVMFGCENEACEYTLAFFKKL